MHAAANTRNWLLFFLLKTFRMAKVKCFHMTTKKLKKNTPVIRVVVVAVIWIYNFQ
jgi:hypothetical protein